MPLKSSARRMRRGLVAVAAASILLGSFFVAAPALAVSEITQSGPSWDVEDDGTFAGFLLGQFTSSQATLGITPGLYTATVTATLSLAP